MGIGQMHCTVRYCTALYCTVRDYTPLYRTVQHYDTIICLQLNDYTTLQYSTAHRRKEESVSLSLTHLQDAIRHNMM